MSNQINHIYEFGDFRLETAEQLLLRRGEPIPLTRKAFDTLLVLVQSSGHLIEKDELMKRVWADDFVEEANLARNVWTLRRALNDDNGEHRYIETVPKRGYRFLVPVREIASDESGVLIQRRVRARIVSEEEEISDAPQVLTKPAMRPRPITDMMAQPLTHPRLYEYRNAALWVFTIAVLLGIATIAGVLIRNASSRSPGKAIESAAVLPFSNLSNDPELAYLSE